MQQDSDWLGQQIQQFREVRQRYDKLSVFLQECLAELCRQVGVEAIVSGRAKTLPSFAEKAIRKSAKYRDPIRQLTDLCGVRAIVETIADIEAIENILSKHFVIDQENSQDVAERLQIDEFGYRSVHYVLQLPKDQKRAFGKEVPNVVRMDEFHPMKAEFQIRTIAQHAWAAIGHDRLYKTTFIVPSTIRRESARLAAMLENVDQSFQAMVDSIDDYRNNYDAYLTKEQIEEEIELQTTLHSCLAGFEEFSKDAEVIARKLSSLERGRGNKLQAAEMAQKISSQESAEGNVEFGKAMLGQYQPDDTQYQEGLERLVLAAQAGNVEGMLELGQHYASRDKHEAHKWFSQAYYTAPDNPGALSGFLDFRIERENSYATIPLLRPSLHKAAQKCRSLAAAGIALPQSFYQLAKFQLFLDKPYAALRAFARALQFTIEPDTIKSAIESLNRIGSVDQPLESIEWARTSLKLVRYFRSGDQSIRSELKSEFDLASHRNKQFVIIAGGTSLEFEGQIESYRKLLVSAFSEFDGVLIGGGTISGVSGIAGEITEVSSGRVFSIGYLPESTPVDVLPDSRYSELVKNVGANFSAKQPLQVWIDIMHAGVAPENIKVLAVSGGDITDWECRLAHALGAKVGVLRDSGGAASEIAGNVREWQLTRVASLPHDLDTIREFLSVKTPAKLDDSQLEQVARAVHSNFVAEQMSNLSRSNPSTKPWEDLPATLQHSNFEQAADIMRKLESIGLQVVPKDESVTPAVFSEQEIEVLARMEHARWNVERLLDGWTLGEKHVADKTNPCLVSWKDLEQLANTPQEWDRQAVRQIPDLLGLVGLMMVRPTPT